MKRSPAVRGVLGTLSVAQLSGPPSQSLLACTTRSETSRASHKARALCSARHGYVCVGLTSSVQHNINKPAPRNIIISWPSVFAAYLAGQGSSARFRPVRVRERIVAVRARCENRDPYVNNSLCSDLSKASMILSTAVATNGDEQMEIF